MSRLLHADASQGASGDMLLGALVDLGVPLTALCAGLERLPVGGFRLEAAALERRSLSGTKVDVILAEPEGPGRTWDEIDAILRAGALPPRVLERARAIFRRLFAAEAEVHATPIETIHLHEAGAVDAIVDVVGTCLGLEHVGAERLVVSPLTTGFGEVRCAHGLFPVPAPATALLVRGAPVRGGTIEGERLTPTGAAILTTLADAWGPLPAMRPTAVGHGAGSMDFPPSPNMLRLTLGDADDAPDAVAGDLAPIDVLECTIDDATPQALAFAAEQLREAGALDVCTTAVTMKKGRLGHQLTVLARRAERAALCRLVLRHTTTLGLRVREERRIELARSFQVVDTRYGPVRVKVGRLDGEIVQACPEYDDCAALARRHGIALHDVQQAARAAADTPIDPNPPATRRSP